MIKPKRDYRFISKGQKRSLSILGLVITLWFPATLYSQEKVKPVILESAELEICGNTNVTNFTCQLIRLNSKDTLSFVSASAGSAELFEGMELQFFVSDFVCDKSLMTSDLKSSLKEKEFPHITLKINKVIITGAPLKNGSQPISAHITLRIAGYSEQEYIDKAFITKSNNFLTLTGSHQVLMTKFQIEPPTKLFGTVRTEDAISIAFAIKLR